jgi:hypothetical protein
VHIADKRYRAGVILADSVGASQPGDIVWTGLNANSMFPGMVPLDAGANTMKSASRFAGVPDPTAISGRDSIDA